MNLLKKIIDKLFKKNEIKLIEAPKEQNKVKETTEEFKVMLKQIADLECDDRNGYKIIPILRLKDMV